MGMNEEQRRQLQQQLIVVGNAMQEEALPPIAPMWQFAQQAEAVQQHAEEVQAAEEEMEAQIEEEEFRPQIYALGGGAPAEVLQQRNAEAAGIEMQLEPREINIFPLWQIYGLPAPVVVQQRNEEATVGMMAVAQQELEAVQVERTAKGQPQQQESPRFSSKKWKRDKQKEAIVRGKGCTFGTAATYDIAQKLGEETKRQEAISDTYAAQLAQANINGSFLTAFCRGFQLGADGQPLTVEDRKNKQLNDAFCADYCSKHLERRVPHLQRMVKDIFAIHLHADALSEKNLRENAGQLSKWADMSACMESIMQDPVNAPYFAHMDKEKKRELEQKLELLGKFSKAFHHALDMHSVNNGGAYLTYVTQQMLDEVRNSYVHAEAAYRQTLKKAQQRAKQKEAAKKEFNRGAIFRKYKESLESIRGLPDDALDAIAGDYSRKMFCKGEILKRLKEDPALGLTEAEKGSVSMDRGVMLMKEGDDAGNLQTLRTLKALDAFDTKKRPEEALYQEAKNLLAPSINKILNCDIKAWLEISDVKLVIHMAELNDLFMDGMFVMDKASLKHPYKTDETTGKPLMLKQEILGRRKHEYDYKATVLRALAERARALAILAKASGNGAFDDSDFTETELLKKNGEKEDFCQERIETAKKLIEAVQQKYKGRFC